VDQLEELSICADDEMDEAQRLVNIELVRLMQHDSIAHPLPGMSLPGRTTSSYEMPPDDAIAAALSEIHLEFAGSLGFPNANWEQVREGVVALSKAELDQGVSWAHDQGKLIQYMTSWAPLNSDDKCPRVYSAVLDENRTTMTKDANKAFKMEKKLSVTLGGYQTRSAALAKQITEAFNGLQEARLEYENVSRLKTNETAVGPALLPVGRLANLPARPPPWDHPPARGPHGQLHRPCAGSPSSTESANGDHTAPSTWAVHRHVVCSVSVSTAVTVTSAKFIACLLFLTHCAHDRAHSWQVDIAAEISSLAQVSSRQHSQLFCSSPSSMNHPVGTTAWQASLTLLGQRHHHIRKMTGPFNCP
jgi:hypothetical protein